MRPIHYLIIAIVACILLAITCENRSLRVANYSLRHRLAQVDSLYHDAEGRYHRTAQTVNRWRQLHRIVTDSLSDVAAELRNIRAREVAYVRTIAQLRADTTDAIITAPAIIDTGLGIAKPDSIIYRFRLPFEGATVDGIASYPPPAVSGSISYTPIRLDIVLSRVGDMYRADIQGPEYVDIRALSAHVVDTQRTGWWRRNYWWALPLGGAIAWEVIRP